MDKLLSIEKIAELLSYTINYTRNIVVKQPHFPEPVFGVLHVNGKLVKTQPRWRESDIEAFINAAFLKENEQKISPIRKKLGRPRKHG